MGYSHYYQEDTDVGLKLAALFLQLCQAPGSLSASEWEYLNSLPLGTLQTEAKISRKDAVHILNLVDQLEADVSKMGRFEHLTDACMMWIVGGSFILAGVLLALLSIPESILGRVSIPISMGVGIFFCCMPFINRKRALTELKSCFENAIVNILGAGLMKRSVLTTDALIREINRREPKKTLLAVVEKFLNTQDKRYPTYEEQCIIEQLLDGYGLKLSDLPSKDLFKLEEENSK